MSHYYFPNSTIVSSSNELTKYFGDLGIIIKNGSKVIFSGDINLDSSITFSGECKISEGVSIKRGSILDNIEIGKNSLVRPYSILNDSRFGSNNIIGPFSFVRDNSHIGDGCIVGNHVEVVRSTLGNNVKISHQAYIGDVSTSENVIIGSGVVFCNFDGHSHQECIVGSDVLIGSGSMIVSPIRIGSHSVIAAGSIITKDLPSNTKFIQKRI